MELSIWDTAMIAAWIVVWLSVAMIFFGIIGAMAKSRKQKNQVYNKLRKAVKTEAEFDRIVKTMKDGDGDTK
jgi:prolipoprotein diacylglyceryltransferase